MKRMICLLLCIFVLLMSCTFNTSDSNTNTAKATIKIKSTAEKQIIGFYLLEYSTASIPLDGKKNLLSTALNKDNSVTIKDFNPGNYSITIVHKDGESNKTAN